MKYASDARRPALIRRRANAQVAKPSAVGAGLNVWVPLADEAAAVTELLVEGWAVSPGERYRFHAGPGIRVSTASLAGDEADTAGRRDREPRAPTVDHLCRLNNWCRPFSRHLSVAY